jgi:hypothetical protein
MFAFRFALTAGYVSNQPPQGSIPNSAVAGSNVLFTGIGLCRSYRGDSSVAGNGGDAMWLVGTEIGGVRGTGSVILYRNAKWHIGSGTGFVGSTTYSLTADLAIDHASYTGPAGLSAPGTVTIAESATVSPKMQGSYSVKLTRVRSSTGAEGNASEASNVLSVMQKKVTVTFPATADGQDKWGIYCTRRGFGATGPWYWLRDVASGGASTDIDWYDGDLVDRFAPFDNDPPLDGTHCFSLGSIMNVAGVLGNGVSPSKPGKPEAFPPDTVVFLNPNETILAVTGRASDGWQYIICRNSLHAAIITGSSINPIIMRPIWTDTGFASMKSFCLVESELYGYTGKRGAVRTRQQSEPDTSFAFPVLPTMEGWTSSGVAVGYSAEHDMVVYGHGSELIAYNRTTEQWSTPLTFSGSVQSMVTKAGVLYISSANALYTFDTGSGSSWSIRPVWTDGGVGPFPKTIRRMMVSANYAVDIALLTNLSTSAAFTDTTSDATSGDHHTNWYKLNVRRAKTLTVSISGSGSAQTVYDVFVDGLATGAHKN